MTLRLRLVLALVVLSTIGLAVFGLATYALYARSLYDRLDSQLRASVPVVQSDLRGQPERGDAHRGGPGGGGPGGDGGPPLVVPPGTYAEVRSSDGTLLSQKLPSSYSTSAPKLPADLGTVGSNGRYFSAPATTGSGDWRVYVSKAGGDVVVVATPMNEVSDALRKLVLIEGLSGAALLGLLAVGSWVILRRGLRPLERMATTARSITAGDLSQRVAPAGDHTEVGELGRALNTMLGEIEDAFREREATEQRLRRFLSDASHELRTPLTSIQGFAELFRLDTSPDHVDLPVILRRIEEEAARMRSLVDDLLLLARLDETRQPQREPVDLAVLAADACSDAAAVAPTRRITLDAGAPVVVDGDRDHLRQAIANMVTNALKHTPPGTPLEVAAAREDGHAVVRVRDHGGGLDDEALAHVFDRFWQADEARAGAGAGLGLAIVAAIAGEHGGEATVSNADGGGAVFSLLLPT